MPIIDHLEVTLMPTRLTGEVLTFKADQKPVIEHGFLVVKYDSEVRHFNLEHTEAWMYKIVDKV